MSSAGALAAFDTPNVRRVLAGAAVLGLALGIQTLVLHLSTDPLADVHAYYDAGARLNAGLPLYDQPATTNDNEFYRYPPLLAIVFRPLAMLPFEVGGRDLGGVPRRVPRRSRSSALGLEPADVDRLRHARPADVLEPRDRPGADRRDAPDGARLRRGRSPWPPISRSSRRSPRSGGWAGATCARSAGSWPGSPVIGLIQLVLEPAGDDRLPVDARAPAGRQRREPLALRLLADRVGGRGRGGRVVAWRLAPTRYGWAAAVVLSVLATPRLLHLPALDARGGPA